MGRVRLHIDNPPEIMSVVLGCQRLAECQLQAGDVAERLQADIRELEAGAIRGVNNLSVAMLHEVRVTFAGVCAAEAAGACALEGAFSIPTDSMQTAQVNGLAAQRASGSGEGR